LTRFDSSNSKLVLDQNIEAAVEAVFWEDIAGMNPKRCRFTIDSITGDSSAPYHVRLDKYDPTHFFVKIKWEYDRLSRSELDPFNRFSFEKVTKRQFFAAKWRRVQQEDDSLVGHVFEAIVVSHAIHNEGCYQCKRRNCLRWNGGTHSPWTDMECIACDSTYEIKSKYNMEAIEKDQERTIVGGSYRDFYALRAQRRCPGWKQYLVEVSRMPSYCKMPKLGPGLHKCWIVQIAEIDRVLPTLRANCFADGPNMILKSHIITKATAAHWFRVPHVTVDHMAIYEKVLEDHFPGITTEEPIQEKPADANDEGKQHENQPKQGDSISMALRPRMTLMPFDNLLQSYPMRTGRIGQTVKTVAS